MSGIFDSAGLLADRGDMTALQAVVDQLSDSCEHEAAVYALLDHWEREAIGFYSRLDALALVFPEACVKYMARIADHDRAGAYAFQAFQSPALVAAQLALSRGSLATAHATERLDLMNRNPAPPPCSACTSCSGCTGCRGCYGCSGCRDCDGCQGCPTCGVSMADDALLPDHQSSPHFLRCSRREREVLESIVNRDFIRARDLLRLLNSVECGAHRDLYTPGHLAAVIAEGGLVRSGDSIQVSDASREALAGDAARYAPFRYEALTTLGQLRPWQREALDSWAAHGRRGVVEAVTGAGKTWVGIAAALEALWDGRLVVIAVPKRVLQEQWFDELREVIPFSAMRLHRLGNAYRAYPDEGLLVAVAHSLAAAPASYPPRRDRSPLLIADECHNYSGESMGKALRPQFEQRLGLTATLEESTAGDFFGGTCYELGYPRALEERAVSEYQVLFLGVDLSGSEVQAYDEAHHQLKRAEKMLMADDPGLRALRGRFGLLTAAIRRRASDRGSKAQGQAQRWVTALERRTEILSRSDGKAHGLRLAVPFVEASNGSLVFTMLKNPARDAASLLAREGVRVESIDSDSEREYRTRILDRLRAGELKAVVAPRILDEGMNVPRIDLAVVVASSHRRRQMIQRLGRIVRAKQDASRPAMLIVLFAQGTVEDPENAGGRESLLAELAENAIRVDVVRPSQYDQLSAVLRDWRGYDEGGVHDH